MPNSPLAREIEKRPDRVRLQGRILFLTEDPDLIRRQLAGWDLPWDTAHPHNNPKLRDDISTDEITPAHICFFFDETLGEFPYTGLKCGSQLPIQRGDVKRGGFVCAVSGKRRGKGSSREQSPYAERSAGIQLVIAENIERIYKQNCQNLGVLTSTDFGLIDRIRLGEEIPLAEFTRGEDEITRQVIEYGGLFPFNVARMQKKVFLPPLKTAKRPMTLAEKIFARHMINQRGEVGVAAVKPGDTGFARTDLRFSHEYVTPMAAIFFEHYMGKDARVNDPASILCFRDHLTFLDEVISEEKRKMGLLDLASQLKLKQEDFAARQGIRLHGELRDRKGSEGICHSIVLESYALPGQLNVGSDSHTPHVGAIGCIAFGIGTTDVFNSWITRDVRVRVPESVRVVIRGRRRPNVAAKDFILKILSLDYVRSGKALAKVMEYTGEAIEELSVDERATMTNMAAEIGGFTGITAPDEKAVEFLMERRGMERAEAEKMIRGLYSDPDAEYAHVIELDASEITPMVATPGDPGNGKYVRELETPVPVEIAYGGTCTAGKNEDMDMYARVLADALRQGKKIAESVKFYIQFGSQETREYCVRQGYFDVFNSWITRDVRVRVPESVRVVIRGRRRANVAAKDFILKILSLDYVRSGKALAKVMEYTGEAIEELSVDERATMTNMAAEIGGFTGITAPDEKAVEFLMERRGMERAAAEKMAGGLYSDPDAEYAHVIELDASEITPMVATPGDPGNGKFVRELETPVPVEIAYGGTCTAGKNEDMDMYARVLADALRQGKKIAGSVKFYIQFGSQETREYCIRQGYLDVFKNAGAIVIEPSCGACINAGPGVSTRPDQIVISAQNRNFPGRSGPGQMYLASPLTVAASAVAGYITEYQPSEQRALVTA